MPRLFVAVDAPADIRDRLAGLPRDLDRAKWVPKDQIHLTLRFIGDADEPTTVAIRDALRRIGAPPIALALAGVGQFPPRGRANVLWAGVGPREPVVALAARVEDALAAAGLPRETRSFSPHITLARLKEPSNLRRYLDAHGALASEPFLLDELRLYSSVLTPRGAIHEVVERYPLRAAG